MLDVLEARLLKALRVVHGDAVPLASGPVLSPGPQQTALVAVTAHGLEVMPASREDDPQAVRGPAYLEQRRRWSADGRTKNFPLPRGEVAEVESPPGRALKAGDDYQIEGGVLKFFRPPGAAEAAVVATLRGSPARGYREKRPCKVNLTVTAWAQRIQQADALLAGSVTAVLAAGVDLGALTNDGQEGAAVRMRLLGPAVALTSIARGLEKGDDAPFFRAEASFAVKGDLEIMVALGVAEPEGVIQRIEYGFGGAPPDFVISALRYGGKPGRVTHLRVHPDHNMTLQEAKVWTKEAVVGLLTGSPPKSFATVLWDAATRTWRGGTRVRAVRAKGNWHLVTDANNQSSDNLGELPKF